MGTGYVRRSTTEIATGEVIEAADFNNEFNDIVSAFTASTGHSHDGTTAEGGNVTKLLGAAITIGDGSSGADIVVTFDGETSDGVLTWMEDEDHFKFSDDIVVDGTKRLYFNDEGGEYIHGDGTDLNLVSGADINIPANIGLTFGDDGEKIEGDGSDLTVSSSAVLTLDAGGGITIDADSGTITFADGGSSLGTITSSGYSGTAAVATVATTVTITDNESTNEDNALIFTAGGDVDGGNIGLESDGTLTYNPSTGKVTATGFIGTLTGTADTATVATTVTITDNESTNEDNALIFTAGGDVDGGNIGLESDGTLTYNPSTGKVTATGFIGSLTGTADTATVATTVTITDNESTNEDNAIIFTAGGDVDGGNIGLESDGTLTYNPSTGKITATGFIGALTGNVTGDVTGDVTGTADVATVATTVTITDNESTNEDNAIIFTAGGDVDGGNIGLESDGTLTYNPSTGKITATGFIGALTGNVTGNVTGDVTGTADVATVATTVTITDNESTNESNALVFTAGGDVDGGNLGLESDGTLTYNPSTGKVTATGFIGGIDVNGTELILDADADTSITADTDDQIDIRIAGADDFQFTANTFTVSTGSIIAVPDAAVATPSITNSGDLNTGIYFPAADTMGITTGGVEQFRFGSNPIPGGAKNLIQNGAFTVAQRGTVTGIGGSGDDRILDRWMFVSGGGGTGRVSASQDAMSVANRAVTGQGYALKIDCTTAESSVAASEAMWLTQRIEAQNLQHLKYGNAAAETVTLSFWFSSPKTGAHFVAAKQEDGTDTYIREFTIASADTFEFFQVTFPGDPTGTIDNNSGAGFSITFPIISGSTYNGTKDAWTGSAAQYHTSDQQNLLDNTANNIYITGVQLEVGNVATDFAHEDITQTQQKCWRRLAILSDGSGSKTWTSAAAYSTAACAGAISLPTPMASAPTMSVSDAAHWQATTSSGNTVASSISFEAQMATTTGQIAMFLTTGSTPFSVQDAVRIRSANSSCQIIASCEL